MITPHPTTKIDPTKARGTLIETVHETATKPAYIKFGVPNSNYELHLRPASPIAAAPGKHIVGTIRVQARRIDVVQTGGEFIEPVYGRPRRVQGTVRAVAGGAVVVDAGVPIHLEPLDPRQKAEQFQPGQFVSCDVLEGATFMPA